MNFDQIIEALGLRKLAAAAASRRSSPGGVGQPPPDAPPQPQQPGPPDTDEADAELGQEPGDDAEVDPDGPSLGWGEEEADDADEDGVEGALQEIHHQIDQVVADVDSNNSRIRGIQSQHEEVLERLDTIEEHNSQLLGVYDRLTAGINPFAEGWQARYDRVRENPENAEHRYNVVELPDGVEQDPVAPESEEPVADESMADATGDDDAVGFEDLRERMEDEPAEQPDEVPARETGTESTPTGQPGAATGDDAYLQRLARGYATEVLLMEWLTMLIDIAGTPGTLKALDYYENIGWISRPVKHRLENLLGGARVNDETPVRTPGDLTTEEHNHSFTYIMKLAQEHRTRPNVHLD